jgi:hypothetical protein
MAISAVDLGDRLIEGAAAEQLVERLDEGTAAPGGDRHGGLLLWVETAAG